MKYILLIYCHTSYDTPNNLDNSRLALIVKDVNSLNCRNIFPFEIMTNPFPYDILLIQLFLRF